MTRFASVLDLPPKLREQAERQLGVRTVKGKDTVDEPDADRLPRNKYNAMPVHAAGRRFDSKHEYAEYLKLDARERAGEISGLTLQVKFALFDPGEECRGRFWYFYVADFVYKENGKTVVADAKSAATKARRDWPRTKKAMLACHGHDVIEL